MRTTLIAIIIAAVAGIIAAAALYFQPLSATGGPQDAVQELVVGGATPNDYRQVNVTVNGFELVADIASTREQHAKGLGVKDTLTEDEAMLFVFTKERQHSFWMYGMKFPIDIIWLDSNKTVVHIEHSLEPCGATCPTYQPAAKSLYVLETVAGFAKDHNVVKGTNVEFQLD